VSDARPALVAALASLACSACALGAIAPASKQTHPRVAPRAGGVHQRFVVRFTARENLGVHGVIATDYRVNAAGPARTTCARAASVLVAKGNAGDRLRVVLAPLGRSRWCRGRFRGVVMFERGPYCPKPKPGTTPTPCPEFASQALDTGHFTFRVR
jgi:hypothetical protein